MNPSVGVLNQVSEESNESVASENLSEADGIDIDKSKYSDDDQINSSDEEMTGLSEGYNHIPPHFARKKSEISRGYNTIEYTIDAPDSQSTGNTMQLRNDSMSKFDGNIEEKNYFGEMARKGFFTTYQK